MIVRPLMPVLALTMAVALSACTSSDTDAERHATDETTTSSPGTNPGHDATERPFQRATPQIAPAMMHHFGRADGMKIAEMAMAMEQHAIFRPEVAAVADYSAEEVVGAYKPYFTATIYRDWILSQARAAVAGKPWTNPQGEKESAVGAARTITLLTGARDSDMYRLGVKHGFLSKVDKSHPDGVLGVRVRSVKVAVKDTTYPYVDITADWTLRIKNKTVVTRHTVRYWMQHTADGWRASSWGPSSWGPVD